MIMKTFSQVEQEYLTQLIIQTRGNVLSMCRISKISSAKMYRRLDLYKLGDALKAERDVKRYGDMAQECN